MDDQDTSVPTAETDPGEEGTTLTSGLEAIERAKTRTSSTKSSLMVTPDMLRNGELAMAAISFICSAAELSLEAKAIWPWPELECAQLPTPIENLAKAGALLATEIDRQLKGGEMDVKGFLRPDTVKPAPKGDFDEVFATIRSGIKPGAVPDSVKQLVMGEFEKKAKSLGTLKQEIKDMAVFLKSCSPQDSELINKLIRDLL